MSENLKQLEFHLIMAYNAAVRMAQEEYPDDDATGTGRTLRSYTLPNFRLWIEGAQAGGIKHLKELTEIKEPK